MYYLGEIVRAETEMNFEPKIRVCEKDKPDTYAPLFVVNSTDKNAIPSVKKERRNRLTDRNLRLLTHPTVGLFQVVSDPLTLQKLYHFLI